MSSSEKLLKFKIFVYIQANYLEHTERNVVRVTGDMVTGIRVPGVRFIGVRVNGVRVIGF